FGDLMAVGGDHITLTGASDVTLGLLSAHTTDASLAAFRLGLTLADNLDLGVTHSVGTDVFDTKIAADAAVTGVTLQIRAVGAADFVDVDPAASYALASVNLTGHLSLLSGVVDAGKTPDFAGHLSLTGKLGAANATAFTASLHHSFDADLTGKVAADTPRARLETAIEGLAALNGAGLSQVLKDTSAAVSALLRTSLFDLSLEYTDLDVTKVYGEIAKVFDGIDEAFLIDPAILGYVPNASGNLTTQVEISNAISSRTAEADLRDLGNVSYLTFVVFSGADKDRHEIKVTLNDDVHDATNATDRAVALAALLTDKLGDYGLTASNAGGKLIIGSQSTTTLPAVALIGAKVNGSYSTGFDLSDLGFGSSQLYSATGVFVTPSSATAAKETDLGLKLVPAKTVTFAPSADIS
ncbi:MAG: hypothetical protein EBU97_06120, partial [Rhodobacteraceae bacterium]|nr:hypothetical protein [Paracoccaceae bacterium]